MYALYAVSTNQHCRVCSYMGFVSCSTDEDIIHAIDTSASVLARGDGHRQSDVVKCEEDEEHLNEEATFKITSTGKWRGEAECFGPRLGVTFLLLS